MKGWSLRSLSEATGHLVSHNALDRYEKGVMMPDSSKLSQIADTLGQPLDFFFRPVAVRLAGISFRKLAKLSETEESSLRETAHDRAERLLEIEELVGVPTDFDDPLGAMKVATPQDAESAAKEIRKRWNLGCDAIPSVVDLLEKNGVKIVEIESSDSFSGLSGWSEKIPVVVLRSSTQSRSLVRKRFTALHEFAHLVLDHRIPDNLDRKQKETIMDVFAGSVLMPEDVLRRELGEHRTGIWIGELEKIKLAYGISIAALIMRAKQTGIVSEGYHRFFHIKHKTQTWKKIGEPGDEKYKGIETCRRFEQLVYRALAEEQISHSKAAGLLGIRTADLWKQLEANS